MGMIVPDLHPLNTVNGEGFKALLFYLKPGYRLPLDELKYIDERVSAFVSITGDIWTSIATHAYLILTMCFLSSEWDMCSIALGTKPLTGRHTGENITI